MRPPPPAGVAGAGVASAPALLAEPLLPLDPALHGLAVGVVAVHGYAAGVVVAAARATRLRRVREPGPRRAADRRGPAAAATWATAVLAVGALHATPGAGAAVTLAGTAVAVVVGAVALVRGVRRVGRGLRAAGTRGRGASGAVLALAAVTSLGTALDTPRPGPARRRGPSRRRPRCCTPRCTCARVRPRPAGVPPAGTGSRAARRRLGA